MGAQEMHQGVDMVAVRVIAAQRSLHMCVHSCKAPARDLERCEQQEHDVNNDAILRQEACETDAAVTQQCDVMSRLQACQSETVVTSMRCQQVRQDFVTQERRYALLQK